MGIEISKISKRFGSTCALREVDLELKEQGLYGLLGNNGAGKTTLFNVITNRLYPDSGSVRVDGAETADRDDVLGKIYMMGEENYYPEDMKVRKAFELTSLFYPAFDKARALELSRQFGIDTKKKITKLSTGYASIFRMILALCVNTPYLLLDEPVLGLDARHRDMFYKALIEKFAETPCTVVISTHLIQEVAHIIGHAVVIRDGAIIKDAPTETLLEGCWSISGPRDKVADFVRGKNAVEESIIGGLSSVLLDGLAEDVPIPDGLEKQKATLQDYFIALMDKEEQRDESSCSQSI
ncbi:MAG TPA: ABC transporter ATP-binding protein [Clostridiales bacterium]|nr:ABC transporter ATP-binding protein [Clostridiales bacterium]